MVSKKEKKLLEFVFEKAKEIDEYMKVNGYTLDEEHYAEAIVFPNKDKPSYVSCEFVTFGPSGKNKRTVALVSVEGEKPGYRENDWREKE